MTAEGRTAVVTGGAGFLGSHLVARLLDLGCRIVCVDDLSTGLLRNVSGFAATSSFRLVERDVTLLGGLADVEQVDFVLHLASPAAPTDYLRDPLRTLRCGSAGTDWCLRLAARHGARFLLASTSEVYGDPAMHPQGEEYRGNVNPVGPRSAYDEAKRYAEALTAAFARSEGLSVAIARIFNTFGPRMRPHDGRVIPQFVRQALAGQSLTVHGDGAQTRSFCYVDDLVDGLVALLRSDVQQPVNLGNPEEVTVNELARIVSDAAGVPVRTSMRSARQEDPSRRRPDIAVARRLLGWSPRIDLHDGVGRTVAWFRDLHRCAPAENRSHQTAQR
ncbi:MAG: NAD-dependent epimerase/dehydratase family protein [Pseudonocardiaceae bacterium]